MLPVQFHWRHDRTRLQLRDYTLIIIDPRVDPVSLINIMRSCMPRRLFFSTCEHAVRYAETWVVKWETDIRLHVGNVQGAAAMETSRRATSTPQQATWTSQDETRRRRGGNRNCKKRGQVH